MPAAGQLDRGGDSTSCEKIELLNPAVLDGGRSPQNSEYPWPGDDGSIIAPADHNFEFNALFERAGVSLLKIIRRVASDLQR